MKDYVISLDPGKNTAKATGREITEDEKLELTRESFRSKIYDLNLGDVEVEDGSHKVMFGDDKVGVIIGEQGTSSDHDTSKTTELQRLCTYTAITKFLEPDTKENKIYLVLACPLEVVKIPEAKEEYKAFIKGDGPININVDDKNYTFEIVDIVIKAEGSGVIYTHPEFFEGKDTAVIDLGGLNLSFSVYRNKVIDAQSRFSEELGGDHLIELVREKLKVYKKGNDVKKEEAEKALKNGFLYKLGEPDHDSSKYITMAKEQYVKDVFESIKEKRQKLDTFQEVVVIGGTTKRVESQIRNDYKNARVPSNPQWESVDGLYKVAYARYVKTKK